MAWHLTWQHGADPASSVKERRLPNNLQLPSSPFPSRKEDSATCSMHMDLVGPLPVSADGFLYIFTIIDRTTRWLEAVPLKEMSAATCSQVFFSHWVSRFGVPATVTSDRGTQFTSDTWQKLCKRLGIEHVTTTSYHP